MVKMVVRGGQTDSWKVSPWRLFETLEKGFAAETPCSSARVVRSGEKPTATVARLADGDPEAVDGLLPTG